MKKQALILTLAIALCILLFGIYFAFLIHNSAKENAEKDQTALYRLGYFRTQL